MNANQLLLRLFLPNKDSWLRHANPWSIWSRFATLPFIVFAIWSRVWIGWYCLIPLLLLIVWVVVNPTLFKPPENFDSWGSKAVLGERAYMRRSDVAIPKHHNQPIRILNILQTLSGLVLAIGLWDLNLYLTIHGLTSVYLTKMWFLDRMVWLYADTTDF